MSIINCQFCNREIRNRGSLKSHEGRCKQNPNSKKYYRSPNAGLKKGSIPWNKGKQVEGPTTWDKKSPDEMVFCENSTKARVCVRNRILKRGLIEYKCACCGIEPFWNGKPMPLILDHINGINNDHRLENLRFVCSNCDTQLPTYKSKNRSKNSQ